jgi:hypothetical protein
MDRDTLLALAERCENTTFPDRELDAAIAAAVRIGTEHVWAWNYPAWEGRADGRVYLEKGGPSFTAPNFTLSVDAASTLFSPSTLYRSGHDGEGPDPADFFCQAMTPAPGCHVVRVVARTEALARTAAALGALAYATQEPPKC